MDVIYSPHALYLIVLEAGLEPAHPRGHYPLKTKRQQKSKDAYPIVFYNVMCFTFLIHF